MIWPEPEDQDINLEWRLFERHDSDGTCEDRHLNGAPDYMELMDGKKVDRVIEYDIQLLHTPAESLCPSNKATCNKTGGMQL